jgi:predicted enzyme related to lactoylglutathione lyase
MPATISSILLSSTDPARLHDWYVAAFEPDVHESQDQYRVLGFGGFWLMIDTRDDIGPASPEPGRIIINVEVDDAAATAGRIDTTGATWLAPLEDRDGSFFATAVDPDGNYVQLIQLSEEAKAQMSG